MTEYEVIRTWPRGRVSLQVFKPRALPERWLAKAAYLSHHAIISHCCHYY